MRGRPDLRRASRHKNGAVGHELRSILLLLESSVAIALWRMPHMGEKKHVTFESLRNRLDENFQSCTALKTIEGIYSRMN